MGSRGRWDLLWWMHVLAFRSGTYKNPKSGCNHMCSVVMRARNYHEMNNISKDVNILGDTITITVRMRRVSFERADLLGPLVGRSVGITRLRNIQHNSTNETIPFYKTLPNIQYICTLLQMKPSLFYVSLSLPYKHILHDMAYFH